MTNLLSSVLNIIRFRLPYPKFLPESRRKVAEDAAAFWSASTDDSRIKGLSHWYGTGRWANEDNWSAVGEKNFARYEKLCMLADKSRPLRSMVEWGPGGGANVVSFCSEVSRIYGVDISEANLLECKKQMEKQKFDGFHPVLINIQRPEEALNAIGSTVDLFISTAVYQHFPSKEYGVKITRLAYELLNDSGIALIQIRYDDGKRKFRPKSKRYARNAITFTSYNIAEFWYISAQAGFNPLAISLKPATNYAYFYLKKG